MIGKTIAKIGHVGMVYLKALFCHLLDETEEED
jgi:hypothetical protein